MDCSTYYAVIAGEYDDATTLYVFQDEGMAVQYRDAHNAADPALRCHTAPAFVEGVVCVGLGEFIPSPLSPVAVADYLNRAGRYLTVGVRAGLSLDPIPVVS